MQLTPMTRLPDEKAEVLEEALSEIYECFEINLRSTAEIEPILDKKVQLGILKALTDKGLASVSGSAMKLSPEGEQVAIRVIRRKRLAERLLKDVLNVSDEFVDPAACQWEHILSKEVTDSICTLLGHPSQSPHDLPIPPGECCKKATSELSPVICALRRLQRGDKAKITYLALRNNPDLSRLLSMGLVPGATVEVIQRFPTFVVQVNESQLAFDESIADAIFVHPLI